MKVLVDTSIWSLALRRRGVLSEDEKVSVSALIDLIDDARVVMIGPIRQELLSGISSMSQFNDLKEHLQSFEDLPLYREYYERAADFFNICRRSGVQGSHIDFLICAVAVEADLQIYTSDRDFIQYAKHLPIRLYGT
ncbi:MAG: putative ribonuclease VapC [Methanomicrobiales archaeon 53_19]|uniref:Twitching motility protein PilT n=1 Tax=Methanocalculus chunghsingensis TaxID=156457 RepID=A0A8J8B4N0_9EURY|nr:MULTISPECIES: PIN domain-containing protein [Methanocalculus]KUK69054.1 MAG: putative ribonuclease VapC [Methanocalculus sp. 52_23]KUL02839.1 MAG: putative ribonuclease VapC [Methanomicrobiales archaeon 53_19]MBR1368248.1 twitching motility protein PilT [Methanocalculus chunghsingensis]HIJ05907.1 PIN domain-containing protein [Methanocalculus sp.]